MKLVEPESIKKALVGLDLMPLIESGFEAYSSGRANVPPVGELLMEHGDVHIKYGCLAGDPYYVIKVASGFHGNTAQGLSPNNGLMLLSSQRTGEVVAVLHDEGYLTDIRTAVAGAIGAKYLAPKNVTRIGIVGTGIQARLQLEYLAPVVNCRDVLVWGRREHARNEYAQAMSGVGFEIETTGDIAQIGETCNLIVTVTPATSPLLTDSQIRPGTHISAIGSDTPHKQELDAAILARADLVVADSIEQCHLRGEIAQALNQKRIAASSLVELGNIIAGRAQGRTDDEQLTVFDSTGVAVQDMMIARAVFEALP